MQLETPITPVNASKLATQAILKFVTVTFNQNDSYAFAHVDLQDEDGASVAQRQVGFTEKELANWGADDTFVLTLALQKLGLTEA